MNLILNLIFCHLIGDYVLQIDFIAKTKGDNLYHLLVHCFLYIVPFFYVFGMTWQLAVILITHIIIDGRKHSVLLTSIDYISKRCDIFLCEHTITDVPFSKIRETVENFLK